jgi:hypothetical protein
MNLNLVALQSAVGLLALWVFVFYFWRDYRTDAFRDHVFDIRERLFLFAARGGVNFGDPAYSILRHRMNVVLRYAHAYTLLRFLSAKVRPSLARSPEQMEWERAVEALPSEATKKKLQEFNTILTIAVLQLMIYRSFFLYLLVRPIAPFFELRSVFDNRPNVVASVEQVESETLEEDRKKTHHDMMVPVV